MYQVIDLLEMTKVFEGSGEDCIKYIQRGPSYDIVPVRQDRKLNLIQSVFILMPIGVLIWYLILKLI